MTAGPAASSDTLGAGLRRLARHRRAVAAAFAGLAVWAALAALAPGPGTTVPVLTAARDLPWGAVIGADDVVAIRLPSGRAPSNVLREPGQAVGHWPASPVRRGEPITDVRLLDGPPGFAGGVDSVAAPIRIADPAAAALLRAGMTIDVLAAPGDGFAAEPRVPRPNWWPPAFGCSASRRRTASTRVGLRWWWLRPLP